MAGVAISIGCVECEAASSSTIHLYLHLAAEDRTRAVCGVECILASLYTEAVVVRSSGPGPGLCSLCPGAAAARTLSDHQFDTQPPARLLMGRAVTVSQAILSTSTLVVTCRPSGASGSLQ